MKRSIFKSDVKKKVGKKRWIIVALLLLAAGISYFNSYQVYRFYSKLYMVYWHKYSPEDIIRIINKKATIGDIQDLRAFVDRSLGAYPDNYKIMKAAGIALIKAGLHDRGIGLSILAYEHEGITSSELYELSRMLYERGDYSDIVALVRSHAGSKDAKVAGILGASLYSLERYEEAIPELERFIRFQGNDIDRLFFLAMSHIRIGEDGQALPYLERAYANDETNRRIIGELVALYGRLGQTKKASQLVNSLSWRLR